MRHLNDWGVEIFGKGGKYFESVILKGRDGGSPKSHSPHRPSLLKD